MGSFAFVTMQGVCSMAGRHAGWPTSKISSSSTSPGHATVNILPYLGVQSIAM